MYTIYHPELVWGKAAQSNVSDIYSFGQVISLVCYYNPSDDLSEIAKQCMHGTP